MRNVAFSLIKGLTHEKTFSVVGDDLGGAHDGYGG
jgi:hypothetical protein